MKALHCCCFSRLLVPAFLLLLLLLPALSGPMAVLLLAAEAAPGPGPPNSGLQSLPPLPPGSTAAQPPGRVPNEAMGPRGAEGGNGSTPRAGLVAEGHEEKAGEGGAVGGGLAVSPNPGDKPMTQRALTVLMVVSGAVLVYFVVRTVRMRRRNRKTRRYGVLDTNIENMELTPLEQDDEDDDNTLFDANHPRRMSQIRQTAGTVPRGSGFSVISLVVPIFFCWLCSYAPNMAPIVPIITSRKIRMCLLMRGLHLSTVKGEVSV